MSGERNAGEALASPLHDHWLWYLKGLQGIAGMMEEYSSSSRSWPPSKDRLGTLEATIGTLQRVLEAERKKAGKPT